MSEVKAKPKKRRRRAVAVARRAGMRTVRIDAKSYHLLVDVLLESLHKTKDARANPGLRRAVQAFLVGLAD